MMMMMMEGMSSSSLIPRAIIQTYSSPPRGTYIMMQVLTVLKIMQM
jgi:hypothetical protein